MRSVNQSRSASTRKSISVEVEDQQGQDWILEVKSPGNGTVKTYTGNGNTSITWDGKNDGGALLPEGKYRFVIKTAARKDFVKHTLPVWIDLTPPEISYVQAKQPNGREVYTISMIDKLSGLDPTTIIVPEDLSQMLLLNQKVNNKKADFKYEILPEPIIVQDGPDQFQTQSIKFPFAIKQISPEVNEEEFETGAFDLASNQSFILAKVDNPRYKPPQGSKPTFKKCFSEKTEFTDSNGKKQTSSLFRLANVYDFDQGGPDLTFVFRVTQDTSATVSGYNMTTDKVNTTFTQQNGVEKNIDIKNTPIITTSFSNTTRGDANYTEKLLYNPNASSDKGDNGSFFITPLLRTFVSSNSDKYPKLNQIISENDLMAMGSHVEQYRYDKLNKRGYAVVGVKSSQIFPSLYQSNEPAELEVNIGNHKIKLSLKFDKKTGNWDVKCK